MPYRPGDSFHPSALPVRRWIVGGGIGLAALAGYINVIALGSSSVAVSHMSGTVSRLGTDLALGNRTDMVFVLGVLVAFMVGAAVAGAIIGQPSLEPGRRYGAAMLTEAATLLAATALLLRGSRAGIPLLALACGTQNGLASSYYGLIIRTTHVTGIVTDLGVLAGQRVRGVPVEGWKPVLLGGLLVGFLLGGTAGQVAAARFGPAALAPAALVCALGGGGYYRWRSLGAGTRSM